MKTRSPKSLLTALATLTLAVAALPATPGRAQTNLLLNNPGFEDSTFNPFIGSNSTDSGSIQGWLATTGANSSTGVSNNPVPAEGARFNYIASDGVSISSIRTNPADRAIVSAGLMYQVSVLSRGDLGGSTPTLTLSFFDGNTAGSLNLGDNAQVLTVPTAPDNSAGNYAQYSFTALAPDGATFAGVMWSNNNTIVADNFAITVIPEPSTTAALVLGGAGLLVADVRRRRRRAMA